MPTRKATKRNNTPTDLEDLQSGMSFGDLIKLYRLQAKTSQSKLARKAGVDPSYVSKLESGGRNPTRERVIQIAEALELDDRKYDRLLDAAGYKTVESTMHFATKDLHLLDTLYRETTRKTQYDIDVALRLLIEVMVERNRKEVESLSLKRWQRVL